MSSRGATTPQRPGERWRESVQGMLPAWASAAPESQGRSHLTAQHHRIDAAGLGLGDSPFQHDRALELPSAHTTMRVRAVCTARRWVAVVRVAYVTRTRTRNTKTSQEASGNHRNNCVLSAVTVQLPQNRSVKLILSSFALAHVLSCIFDSHTDRHAPARRGARGR